MKLLLKKLVFLDLIIFKYNGSFHGITKKPVVKNMLKITDFEKLLR